MIEKYERDLPTLTINDLETLIDIFQVELQVRKDEHDKIRRQYQDDLDRLLSAMEDDGFYVAVPDDGPSGLADYVVTEMSEH